MGVQVKVEIHVEGRPRRLPVPVEMNLLRIGQEAVTNAIKHAHAQQIVLKLSYDPESVGLRVTDDGCGFSAESVALSSNGHFGLLDMRERAQSLGSDLRVKSEPGEGTCIDVDVAAKTVAAKTKEPPHADVKTHTYSSR
jgi:signal transduction histidine kinase